MILLSGRIHKKKNVLFELLEILIFFFQELKKTQELSYKECGFAVLTLEMLGLC